MGERSQVVAVNVHEVLGEQDSWCSLHDVVVKVASQRC